MVKNKETLKRVKEEAKNQRESSISILMNTYGKKSSKTSESKKVLFPSFTIKVPAIDIILSNISSGILDFLAAIISKLKWVLANSANFLATPNLFARYLKAN